MTLLVDQALYGRATNDPNAYGPGISDALTDAQNLVEEHCKRKFGYGTHTETLYVYPDGKVYPSVIPLETVTAPATNTIQGAGVYVGWFNILPLLASYEMGYGRGAYPPQTTITYTGGYQPYGTTDGPTPQLPPKVAYAICQVAFNILHAAQLPNVPSGATSVHVGDVGFSGASLRSGDVIDSNVTGKLGGYVRRPLRGWQ